MCRNHENPQHFTTAYRSKKINMNIMFMTEETSKSKFI